VFWTVFDYFVLLGMIAMFVGLVVRYARQGPDERPSKPWRQPEEPWDIHKPRPGFDRIVGRDQYGNPIYGPPY
jgi:hypothetical protein